MTRAHEEPWWASGGEGGLGEEDPFEAHRSARGGSQDPVDPIVRILRQLADGRHRLDGETCGVCPLCSAIAALDDARPELVRHLSEAARHLTLAVKAFVDAQAASYGADGFERIEVVEDDGPAGSG